MMKIFKESARPYLQTLPRNEWEWLTLAQHHGMPTRLLDWTFNPLVAAYFAVEKESSEDGAIWVFSDTETIDTDAEPDPYAVKDVRRLRPPHLSPRIIAQSALHTVHPQPDKPIEGESVARWIIAAGAKRELKKILFKYGFSRRTLFPGLDSVAHDAMWVQTGEY